MMNPFSVSSEMTKKEIFDDFNEKRKGKRLSDNVFFIGSVSLDAKNPGNSKVLSGKIKRVEECDNLKEVWRTSDEMEKHRKEVQKMKKCKIL